MRSAWRIYPQFYPSHAIDRRARPELKKQSAVPPETEGTLRIFQKCCRHALRVPWGIGILLIIIALLLARQAV